MTPTGATPWTDHLPLLAALLSVVGWALLGPLAWLDRSSATHSDTPAPSPTRHDRRLKAALVAGGALAIATLPLAWLPGAHGLEHLLANALPGHGTPSAGYGLHWWLAVLLRVPIALTLLVAGPVAVALAAATIPTTETRIGPKALLLCLCVPGLLTTLADGSPAAGAFVLHALAWWGASRLGPGPGALLAALLALEGPSGWVSALVALESSGRLGRARVLPTLVTGLLPTLSLLGRTAVEPAGGDAWSFAVPALLAAWSLALRRRQPLDQQARRELLGSLLPLVALVVPVGVAAAAVPMALVALLPPLTRSVARQLGPVRPAQRTLGLLALVLGLVAAHARDPGAHLPRTLPARLILAARARGLPLVTAPGRTASLGRAPPELLRRVLVADLPGARGTQRIPAPAGAECLVLGVFGPDEPRTAGVPQEVARASVEADGWLLVLVEAGPDGCARRR